MTENKRCFHITERPGRSAGYCMVCNCASEQVYVFPLGLFILRLCRDCLAQFRQESGEMLGVKDVRLGEPIVRPSFSVDADEECPKGGAHQWGIDGAHSNEYCKKCFVSRKAP